MVVTFFKWIKRIVENIRIKKAIKKANRLFDHTGMKFIVIWYDGKPLVKSKQELKKLIQTGFFKGITIQEIEQKALYKTR